MDFDIIITTYNRSASLETLVSQIMKCDIYPTRIIVVDSSKKENTEIQNNNIVKYIQSSHANQPYQRYVGYLASTSSILVYLDDDMEIADQFAFKKILENFQKKEVIGLAINFINENEFLQRKVPKSKFASTKGIMKTLKTLSGQSELSEGEYGFNGLKGAQPKEGGITKWFRGGAFAARREFLYKGFNFKLFDLYEEGLGKGEDGILGYTLSKSGRLLFEPKILFIHNDKKDSTYTQNFFSFSRRVIYSRLYLSYEFSRLNDNALCNATLRYHWYVLWRVMGIVINQVLNFKDSRKEMLKGYLEGWRLAFQSQKELQKYKNESYWEKEAKHDIGS